MTWLGRRLVRAGLRRGLGGGSSAWLAVGITAAAAQVARWLLREKPDRVFAGRLRPGDAIEVRVARRGR